MDDVHVLVLFYSRGGETERLAVLMAEGAVQAGGSIRLRRARDVAEEATLARDEGWRAARDRMEAEYAAPQERDAEWADAVCVGTPAGLGSVSPELALVLDAWRGRGLLRGRVGTAFTSSYGTRAGAENAVTGLEAMLLRAGMVVVPAEASRAEGVDDFERARRQGRLAAEASRAVRAVTGRGEGAGRE